MTWLFVNTRGSLLLVMLMHSALNQTTGIVPARLHDATNPFAISRSLVAWIMVALLWSVAVVLLARMRNNLQESMRDEPPQLPHVVTT